MKTAYVTLGADNFALGLTYTAAMSLEAAVGEGLVPLSRRFMRSEYGFTHVEEVLRAGIKGAGGSPPVDLRDRILDAGLLTLAPKCLELMLPVLKGRDFAQLAAEQGVI